MLLFGLRRQYASQPAITSISPSTGVRWDGAGGKSVTVTGTGFTPAAQAKLDGATITTVYNSATSLTVTVPNTVLWEVGTKVVTVVDAGGTTPAGANYVVSQPSYLEAELRFDMGLTLNAGNVQACADQSSKGDANRNLLQTTSGNQPVLTSSNSSYNNKPTIALTGSRWLVTGAWSLGIAMPVRHYWVGENTAAAAVILFDGLSGGGNKIARIDASNVVLAAAAQSSNSPVWDSTGKTIAVAEFNGASSKLAKSAKTLSAVGGTVGSNTENGITEGRSYSGAIPMTGTLAYHAVVSSGITTAQHGELMDFLGTRFGITVAA